jgi:hypothetical protein
LLLTPRFKLPYKIQGVCRLLMPAREMFGVLASWLKERTGQEVPEL